MWKQINITYYDLIVKLTGENYDTFDEFVYSNLSEDELSRWKTIVVSISERVECVKRREQNVIPEGQHSSLYMKTLYDFCEKEDAPYVTKVIEMWQQKTLSYYQLIVKLTGETYDRFDEETYMNLPREEYDLWIRILLNIHKRVEVQKKKSGNQKILFQKNLNSSNVS